MRCLQRERERESNKKQVKDQIMISKPHLGTQFNVQSLYVELFHIHFLNTKTFV